MIMNGADMTQQQRDEALRALLEQLRVRVDGPSGPSRPWYDMDQQYAALKFLIATDAARRATRTPSETA